MSTQPKTHEILILGAHHAGVNTAHYLLRHIIPPLSKLTPSTKYSVTVVSPNTEFFWNIAAPRHVANEDLIPTRSIWLSIADAFRSYKPEQYSIKTGKAVSLDARKRMVRATLKTGENQELNYSTLVIATGATFNSPIWQVNGDQDATKAAFSSIRKALSSAKTALIAGGGPIGVETAGEVATRYPKLQTTLLSGSSRLLPRLLLSNSSTAESRLDDLGVQTLHDLRVTSESKTPSGGTELKMNDGSSRTVDVFIDATGGKPNSSFLPSSWLNGTGHVITDDKTMRATAPGAEDVYAIGDVASYSDGSIMAANNAVAPLATSIGIDIARKYGVEKQFEVQQKVYRQMKGTQFVPTGPSGGVGQINGWKVPSLMVWAVKSRTFFVWMAEGAVEGSGVTKP